MTCSRRGKWLLSLCVVLSLSGPVAAEAPEEGPVKRWLEAHCREILQSHYRDRGESGTCTWENLSVSGRYPDLTISFTRVETLRKQGSRTVRLSCTPTECKTVEEAAAPAAPSGGAAPAGTDAAAAPPASAEEESADPATKEALTALRRAEDKRDDARRTGGDKAARGRWSAGLALLAEARGLLDADPLASAEKARAARQEFVAARAQSEKLALEAAISAAQDARARARGKGADRDPAAALQFADAERDLDAAAALSDDRVAARARAERAARKFERAEAAAHSPSRPDPPAGIDTARDMAEAWLRGECEGGGPKKAPPGAMEGPGASGGTIESVASTSAVGPKKAPPFEKGGPGGICTIEIRGISGVPSDLTVYYVRSQRRAAGDPVASVEGVVRLACQGGGCNPLR